MNAVWRRLQLLYGLGVATLIGRDKIQTRLLDGEVLDNLARVQPYGYSYRPKPGAQVYALFPNGDRSYGTALLVGDKRYTLDLQEGEAALHDDLGRKITMSRGGIAIAGGGANVAITGAPKLTVSGGDVVADGVGLKTHVHSFVDPGSGATFLTGPPLGGTGSGGGGGIDQGDLDQAVSDAEAAAVAALAAQVAAVQAEIDAQQAKNAAIVAKTEAILAQSTASDWADAAAAYASNAQSGANDAGDAAALAANSATAAANSATAAGNSATAASGHKDAAYSYSTAAGDSASLASTAASNAASSQTAAGNSATAAATSATSASTAATNAANSASAAEAAATSVSSLTARVDTAEANISNEAVARANADSALAGDISTLSSTVGGYSASISTLQTTTNGLQARYGVTINNNGAVSGFALNSTAAANGGNPTSAFVIQADKFAIVNGSYSNGNNPSADQVPFQVVGGVTKIKIAAIGVASLSEIVASTGTLTVSGSLKAGSSPNRSGQAMTGSGLAVESGGGFAFGNSSNSIVYDGSNPIKVNGQLVGSDNLQVNSVAKLRTFSGGASGIAANTETMVVNLNFTSSLPTNRSRAINIGYSAGATTTGLRELRCDIICGGWAVTKFAYFDSVGTGSALISGSFGDEIPAGYSSSVTVRIFVKFGASTILTYQELPVLEVLV